MSRTLGGILIRMQGHDRLSRKLAWALAILAVAGFWWPITDLWTLGALIVALGAIALFWAEAIARKGFMGAIVVAGLGIVAADLWPPPVAGSEWEYVAIEAIWACQLAVSMLAILSLITARGNEGSTSG